LSPMDSAAASRSFKLPGGRLCTWPRFYSGRCILNVRKEQHVPPRSGQVPTALRSVENISRRGPLNCRSLDFARDDKGEGDAPSWHLLVDDGNSRSPSTSLRAGSPLRCASVGMTKGRPTVAPHISLKNERDMGHPGSWQGNRMRFITLRDKRASV
jgi:hypothetical protein